MLDEVLAVLRCPVCGAGLARAGKALRCPAGHTFDLARQGYVNLLTGRSPAGAETPSMVAARSGIFEAGHLSPVTTAIVAELPGTLRLAVDAGAGTGHHLTAVLEARPGSLGVALDVSKAAARRSAHAHQALSSLVADVWRRLPLADACADVVLDVFAPRNGAEFRRVLREDGTLLVVTPAPDHLAELVGPLGLLRIGAGKAERLAESLARWFEPVRSRTVRYGLALRRDETALVVGMGPNAWHVDQAPLRERLAGWPEPVRATVSVELSSFRPTCRG